MSGVDTDLQYNIMDFQNDDVGVLPYTTIDMNKHKQSLWESRMVLRRAARGTSPQQRSSSPRVRRCVGNASKRRGSGRTASWLV